MGFPAVRTYVLDFTDHPDLDGLEVRVRSVTVATYLDILGEPDGLSRVQASEASIQRLADALVSWNIEDDSTDPPTPIPPTFEGMKRVDANVMTQVVIAFSRAVAGVPDPLDRPSTDGAGSEEAELSIPMEPLSPSPGS
jgi:hypothetical protein